MLCRSPKNKKALNRIFADNSKPKILALVPEVGSCCSSFAHCTSCNRMQLHIHDVSPGMLLLLIWGASRMLLTASALLQSNKKVDDFRKVLTKITTERKDKYNVLWADPKSSPQVRLSVHIAVQWHHDLSLSSMRLTDALHVSPLMPLWC